MQPTILVVDDEAGPRQSLRMILKSNYDVHLAAGAYEGLELVKECKPEVVFLDIKMPEMDGIEMLHRIKATDPDIEVAMITAYAAIDSAQQALRLGAIDYLTKPFGVNEVLGVVERALAKRHEQREQQVLLEQLQQATATLSEQLREVREQSKLADQATIYEGLASAHTSIENQLGNIGQLAAIGEIAAEVAHDVNNFLSAILLRLEVLLMTLSQPGQVQLEEIEQGVQEIIQATRDSAYAVERISALSKSDPYARLEPVQVNDILADAVKLSAAQSDASGAPQIIWETQEIPQIMGNPPALRTALMNVLINARQAIDGDGEIRVRTYREENSIVIEISDTGVGMPPEVVQRVTESFFTTRDGSGSGLGLSIAHKVIARHGGSMAFDSSPGVGTTVNIRLPIDRGAEMDTMETDGVPRVLVVDDDVDLLALVEALFNAEGIPVSTVNTGRGGLNRFEQYLSNNRQTPPVVVVDLRMPDLMGTELARRIKELVPETYVIMLSAYVSDETELVSSPYLDAVIKKPFDVSELLAQVRKAVAVATSDN